MTNHFSKLENMYLTAPVNIPATGQLDIHITHGKATIQQDFNSTHCHAAHSVHGAFIFKLLDDAAFFAAQAEEPEYMLLTGSFTINFRKEVFTQRYRAFGEFTKQEGRKFFAKSVLKDRNGNTVAQGEGTFIKSSTALSSIKGYRDIAIDTAKYRTQAGHPGREISRQLAWPKGDNGIQIAKSMEVGNKGLTELAIRMASFSTGMNVLDLGFGNGWHLPQVAKAIAPGSYHGVDRSALMCRMANQKIIDESIENAFLHQQYFEEFDPAIYILIEYLASIPFISGTIRFKCFIK